MARKTTLSVKNLEALGTTRLAELLIELGKGNDAAKRRMRLALAAAAGPEEVANQIGKRLRTVAKATSYLDRKRSNALIKELELQRGLIMADIAESDPRTALDLMWEFAGLAAPVYERCDEMSQALNHVFRTACENIGELALAAKPDAEQLASRVFVVMQENIYDEYDGLIASLAPALGEAGLTHLRTLFEKWADEPEPELEEDERVPMGWTPSGPVYEDDIFSNHKKNVVHYCLVTIADALGDVDGFIGQFDETERCYEHVAAAIAQRLLETGRPDEALAALEASRRSNVAGRVVYFGEISEWDRVRIDVLEALGRKDDAQSLRWGLFESTLDDQPLRAFLKQLPDFDDMEAERKALEFVMEHDDAMLAFDFFVRWQAFDSAARLVETRIQEFDGNHYAYLRPAADWLEGKHPLAATLLRRAMIDFSLENGRSSRYRHAARHLIECESLAVSIADYGEFPDHETYRARLEAEHPRKTSFWNELT